MKNMKETVFNFRLIDLPDGSQIMDKNLVTPIYSLDIFGFMEYLEMEKQNEYMEYLERKRKREEEKQNRKSLLQRFLKNVACLF